MHRYRLLYHSLIKSLVFIKPTKNAHKNLDKAFCTAWPILETNMASFSVSMMTNSRRLKTSQIRKVKTKFWRLFKPPQNIRVQIIAIKSNWPNERKGKFNWTWPQTWRTPLVYTLDSTDEIELFFFNLKVGNGEPQKPLFINKDYWNRSGHPTTLKRGFWEWNFHLLILNLT